MAGNKAGGQAAAATNKKKYGADFYAKIGAKGGKEGHTGGFYRNPELARIAGTKGGRKSKRPKSVNALVSEIKSAPLRKKRLWFF